jgi:hypothetical protein
VGGGRQKGPQIGKCSRGTQWRLIAVREATILLVLVLLRMPRVVLTKVFKVKEIESDEININVDS